VTEHLLATGIHNKRLITFEQMHPSMAKLPSQEDTALAFAEVYTVVEYLVQKHGWEGVRKLVGYMRDGKSDSQAVAALVGQPFDAFQREWRAWLSGRKLRARPGLMTPALKFRKNTGKKTEASEDESSDISEERARKLARLGGMLRARHRLRAAAAEYEKAQAILGPGNPLVASKLARTWLELGDADRAIKTAEPALDLYPDQSGLSATLGEAWLKKGDLAKAETHLYGALAVNPFDPALACGLEKVYRQRGDARAARAAAACRALGGE
jgi:tetratricopeptide (TPR) repeat protein